MSSQHSHKVAVSGKSYSTTNATAGTIDADLAALTERVAKLEGGTQPVPPTSGIPPIPAGQGAVYVWNFASGSLGPFVAQDYPNAHPSDLMVQYGTVVTDATHVSVHDGYLDLLCDAQGNGKYNQVLVATFAKNDATRRTLQMAQGIIRVMAQIVGQGTACWQDPLWLCDLWSSPEIDWPEVIGGRITANLHGSLANGQKYAGPIPSGWHEYGIEVRADHVTGYLDKVQAWTAPVAMLTQKAILIDAKVGLAAPDATTPQSLRTQVAWLTIDA